MYKKIVLNKKTKIIPSGRRGFTLLELITVIAIIAIISAISWSTLGDTKKQSDANNACEQVASMINKTRNYAVSGKLSPAIITISSNSVSINSAPAETVSIPGGVNCGSWTSTYVAPNAIGTNINNINCTSGTASRVVNVTAFRAVCN